MMSENEPTSNPTVTPMISPARSAWQSPFLYIALAALALSGWQWLETRHKLNETQQAVARQLAEFDTANKEDQGAQKELRQQIDTLQAKLGAFESKLGEFQGQGTALQNLYQEAARGREEVTLLEVEQAITLAGQQLQLAANVPVALLALQTADARLARIDRPQYLPLRKALAKDIQRLNTLPTVDVPGISLRLEQVVVAVEKLPLAAYGRPPEAAENTKSAPALPWWQRGVSEFWQELKGLIRIQRFDQDEAVLLAPGQEFFLRENLKLRLLNARLALLSRDQTTFRNEVKMAQAWLVRYFVADDKAVHAAAAALQQMAVAQVNLDLPSLNETLSALRNIRTVKDKR